MVAYIVNLATLMSIFCILAASLNIMMGYAGIFSVSHAVFFGLGSYAAALISLHLTSDILVSSVVAALVSATLSLCLALPALRVRGEYFVISSLGLQVVAVTIFTEAKSVTGGLGGLVGIPVPTLFGFSIGSQIGMLVTCVIVLLLVLATTWALMRNSFGRSLMAIRDSEVAAQALGKNVAVVKSLAVIVSCGFAGIAGALFAFQMAFVNVESFNLDQSMLITAMVIIGGIGTLAGPILGAILLFLLPAALSFVPFIPPTEIGVVQKLIYGLAMVLLMIFRPAGIGGKRV